jgi:SpoVK/Ycf46/Vps4 family AAA+-type ATPase
MKMDAFYLKVKYSKKSHGSQIGYVQQDVLLPKNVFSRDGMKKYVENHTSCVVEVSSYNDQLQNHVLKSEMGSSEAYFPWFGKFTDQSDTIEVPTSNMFKKTRIQEDDIVCVTLHSKVPEAKSVYVNPKTSRDWDTIQNHAAFVENHLLRQLSVIYLGQELEISITPSISVTLRVDKIEYEPLRTSSSNGYIIKARESAGRVKEVARINSATELLVNPADPSSSTSSSVNPNPRSAGLNSDSTNLIQDQIQESSIRINRFSLIDLRKMSQSIPLRVLPQRCRHQVVSSFSQADFSHLSSSSTIVDEASTRKETELDRFLEDEDYLNSFLSNSPLPDHSLHSKNKKFAATAAATPTAASSSLSSSSSSPSVTLPQSVWQVNDNYLDSSICQVCNAFIHPLYLKTVIERQLKLSSPSSLLTQKDLEEFLTQHSYPFLGLVRRITPKHEVPSSSFLNEYIVRVYLTEKILPFSISLPSIIEKSLSIIESDLVTLEIRTRFRARFPVSVSFQPVIWEDRKDSSFDNVENKANKKDMETLMDIAQNNVIDAFLKFLSVQSQKEYSFLLSHNSLISLPLSSKQSCSTTTSSFSSSFDHLLKSSPLKLKEMGSEEVGLSTFSQDFLVKFSYDSTIKKGSRKGGRSNPLVSPRSEDSLTTSDEFSLAYLPLSYDNGTEEDYLYEIISSLQVEMNYPVRGFLSNKVALEESAACTSFPISSMVSSGFTLLGIEKLYSQILQEVSSQFSSFYLLNQLLLTHSALSSQKKNQHSLFHQLTCHNYLITGETGTGKTTFLRLLQRELTASYQVTFNQIHIEYIDMKELLSLKKGQLSSPSAVPSIPEIISQFQRLFDRCKYYSPTILLIDNLDYLCSSINNGGGNGDGTDHNGKIRKAAFTSNGSPILRDERLLILSTYFIRFLNDYYDFLQKKYERNTVLLDLFLSSSKSDSSSASVETERPAFWKETILSAFLQHSLFIIATAESLLSLDHLLIKNNESRKEGIFQFYLSLPLSFTNEINWKLLMFFLNKENIPFSFQEESTDDWIFNEKKRKILLKIQSYRYSDFHYLISNILPKEMAYRMFLLNDEPSSNFDASSISFSCTMEDLENAVTRYIPLSLQENNQFSSASSLMFPSSSDSSSNSHHHAISLVETSSYFSTAYSQMIEIFRYPVIYSKLYASLPLKLPHAIMLYGEPGCGKSYLASQIGKEFQLSTGNSFSGFLTIRGPQLLNKYIGESEKSIRSLFQLAKQQIKTTKQSVLIFFDEFESLAPKRGKDNTGITDRIVNQLLTFIDGVESTLGGNQQKRKRKKASKDNMNQIEMEPIDKGREIGGEEMEQIVEDKDGEDENEDEDDDDEKQEGQIFILIATSRPDLIDPALLRPGRIEKHIHIGFPETSKQYEELLLSMIEPYLSSSTPLTGVKEKRKHDKRKSGDSNVNGNDEVVLMKEIIYKISNDLKIFRMTLADVKAIIDTSYLKAVHQKISSLSISSENGNVEDKIVITSEILFQAFQETKPSIHESDRSFFDQIYSKFKKSSKNEKTLRENEYDDTRKDSGLSSGRNADVDTGNAVKHGKDHEKNGKKKSVQESTKTGIDSSKDNSDEIDRLQKLSFR